MNISGEKTMADVFTIAMIAKKNKVRFDFNESNFDEYEGTLGASRMANIYLNMSPTDMWEKIRIALSYKNINIYQDNFNALKEFIEG